MTGCFYRQSVARAGRSNKCGTNTLTRTGVYRAARARAVRVGKSTLVRELRHRGLRALDADDDGFSEPRADGRWGWRVERVADLLKQGGAGPDALFFAGCSEEPAPPPVDSP